VKALIDGDIFAYEFGSCTDDEYKPLSWPLVQARVQARINGIMEATEADEYQIYLTAEDNSNFRIEEATILPYKGHRESKKPHWYRKIREFLVDHRGAEVVYGMEADDALSIAQYKAEDRTTVICSRDKDLNMVPGYHYSWGAGYQKEKEVWYQTETEGLRCFYKQLLTGDSTDNILGLYGVGKSSKLLVAIDECDNELDMLSSVVEAYEKRFGAYARQFLTENGRLLWMLKEEGELWEPLPEIWEEQEDGDEI
jgi:hypothetical protein